MRLIFLLLTGSMVLLSCVNNSKPSTQEKAEQQKQDSLEKVRKEQEEAEKQRPRTVADIKLKKELKYDRYTLDDTYKYKDTVRQFQWEKIKEKLAQIENLQRGNNFYAIVSNYKNKNGEAPTVPNYKRNAYKRVSDTLGTERYQSAPLYEVGNDKHPVIYGRDGSLVKLLSSDTLKMVKVQGLTNFEGEWEIPRRYLILIGDTVTFKHVVVVDIKNQNICTLDHVEDTWYVRSMNAATTGRHAPPYAMETPVGIFVVQERKAKMFYYKDGTTSIEGFAPWASRFTNGAYIHGIPVNNPKGQIIETSPTLGTIPRSHMCVRTASSHSKFIYDWIKPHSSLVIVID